MNKGTNPQKVFPFPLLGIGAYNVAKVNGLDGGKPVEKQSLGKSDMVSEYYVTRRSRLGLVNNIQVTGFDSHCATTQGGCYVQANSKDMQSPCNTRSVIGS